jgi:glycosyltransferase involved in cell wall biosynthesis
MRILTITNTEITPNTGSGYVVDGFICALGRRGHMVVAIDPSGYEPLRWLRRANQYRQAVGMLAVALWKLAMGRYDVVEFYGAEAWLAIMVLAWWPRRRFLLVAHSNGLEPHVEDMFREARRADVLGIGRRWYQLDQSRLFELGFKRVDGIVTVGEWDRQYALERRYQDDQHVVAIENPLPDDYLGLEVDFHRELVIGYCGTWLSRKGTETMMRDVPQILEEYPESRLLIVGVGHAFQKEQHFPTSVVGRIEVIPFLDRGAALRDLYCRLAVLILPSIYESFGLVAAEAMACGCAVVGTKVGFLAGLKDGEEAGIMEEKFSPALYSKLKELIDNEALRQRIARGGYQRVQNLSWDRAGQRLEETYGSWLRELQKYR